MTLAQCAWAFPLVGLLAGGVSAGIFLLASEAGLAPAIAAWLAIAAQILLTGGLHEDGLADMADAAAFGRDREQKLAIMRDSRIGSFGVLALIVVIGLRAAVLGGFPADMRTVVILLVATMASRSMMVLLMGTTAFARADGLAAGAGRPSRSVMFGCLVMTLGGAMLLTGPYPALMALLVAAIAAWMLRGLAMRHFGGITGDVLGAAQQLTELLLLIVLTLLVL